MDKGTWWATVHGVTEQDTTEATQHAHICHAICFKARSLFLSSILEIPKWRQSTFCHCVLCFIVYYKKEGSSDGEYRWDAGKRFVSQDLASLPCMTELGITTHTGYQKSKVEDVLPCLEGNLKDSNSTHAHPGIFCAPHHTKPYSTLSSWNPQQMILITQT